MIPNEDKRLILELAKERQRLRREANALSNERIAEKFGVSFWTVQKLTRQAGFGR